MEIPTTSVIPPHPIPEGMLSRSSGMPSRTDGPPSNGKSGNVLANPDASSSVQRIKVQTNNDCRLRIWKIRFKIEVCTCSQFPTEAMQWIKEMELVDSVDELRSSSSTRGISMPNFEVLDAWIASALNKFIHNSHFKRRISLEEQKDQMQDRFLRGRQIASLICE